MYYLFLISILVYRINITFGIDFGSARISISDIMALLCVVLAMKRTRFPKNKATYCLIGLVAMLIVWVPLGLLSGGTLVSCFRVIRNWIFALETLYILYDHFLHIDKEKFLREIYIIGGIAVADGLYNVLILYRQNQWFMNYRVNATLFMALFGFVLFYEDKNNKWHYSAKWILATFILLCSALSQERTQLVVEFIVLVLCISMLGIRKIKNSRNGFVVKRSTINKVGFATVFLLLFVFVLTIVYRHSELLQNYYDYYVKYRIQLILNQSGQLQMDSSLSTRWIQFLNLTVNKLKSSELLSLLIGSGTCSLYDAGYMYTYVVDGMVLWILKDIGVVGLSLYIFSCIKELKKIKELEKNTMAFFALIFAVILSSLFKPMVMHDIYDAFAFGAIWALIECVNKKQKSKNMLVDKTKNG